MVRNTQLTGLWGKVFIEKIQKKAKKYMINYSLSDWFIWESLVGRLRLVLKFHSLQFKCIDSGFGFSLLNVGYQGIRATTV